MGRARRGWRRLLGRRRGHLRHGAGTGGTEGGGTEEEAATLPPPGVQAAPAGASLSRGPGTCGVQDVRFYT